MQHESHCTCEHRIVMSSAIAAGGDLSMPNSLLNELKECKGRDCYALTASASGPQACWAGVPGAAWEGLELSSLSFRPARMPRPRSWLGTYKGTCSRHAFFISHGKGLLATELWVLKEHQSQPLTPAQGKHAQMMSKTTSCSPYVCIYFKVWN